MSTDLKQEVNNISEQLLEYDNKALLIFFAVYGFFKVKKIKVEPNLIKHPLDSEVIDAKIRFKQKCGIEINNEEYPILEDAEKTLLNVIKGEKIKWQQI